MVANSLTISTKIIASQNVDMVYGETRKIERDTKSKTKER